VQATKIPAVAGATAAQAANPLSYRRSFEDPPDSGVRMESGINGGFNIPLETKCLMHIL